MAFKPDGPTYTHIQCPRCGHWKTIPSWKLADLFKDRGVKVERWAYDWFGPRLSCPRCGTRGMMLSARG